MVVEDLPTHVTQLVCMHQLVGEKGETTLEISARVFGVDDGSETGLADPAHEAGPATRAASRRGRYWWVVRQPVYTRRVCDEHSLGKLKFSCSASRYVVAADAVLLRWKLTGPDGRTAVRGGSAQRGHCPQLQSYAPNVRWRLQPSHKSITAHCSVGRLSAPCWIASCLSPQQRRWWIRHADSDRGPVALALTAALAASSCLSQGHADVQPSEAGRGGIPCSDCWRQGATL